MKALHLSAAAAAAFVTSAAQGQTCASYIGQTITPKAFEQAIAALGNASPKGEFETTAQYQARIGGGSTGPLIISKRPEDPKFFEYSADAQMLTIKSYAFHNTDAEWWGAFYQAKPAGITASTSFNRAVVISQTKTPTGSYKAQNGFGASANVIKVNQVTNSIFETESPYRQWGIFAEENGGIVGSIPMDVETAQRLKPTLKIAFVAVPKPPFLVQGSQSVGETTISNPTDVTERFRILIADLQCGLLTDGTNKVLAAYPIK